MSRVFTIAQRELSSMFRVPAGWIIIALFAFLTGLLFVNQTIVPGQTGTLRYFFLYSGWLLIPIAPAISMRLMSEEYRSGSFEALRTAPAGDWAVTLGKYLGSVAFLIFMMLPTLVYPILLYLVSDPAPDLGPILAGYLMLLLVGLLYLGIGMVASSLTSSQTLAFLGTVMSLILMMVLTSIIAQQSGVKVGTILSALSIQVRIEEFSKGIVDTATIAFFLIGSIWMLVLASAVLEIRRLGRSRFVVSISVVVFLLATTAAVIFTSAITNTYHYRVDVTSTGAHKLSSRATGIVNRLTDSTKIILAISKSRADQRSVDLVSDVLDAYEQSSSLLQVQSIDLDSPEGIDETKQLLLELADRDSGLIASNMSALESSAQTMLALSPKLAQLALNLDRVAQAIEPTTQSNVNNRAVFEQRANIIRMYTNDLLKQGEGITSQIADFESSNEVFPFDTYAEPIEQSLSLLMNQLDDLSVQVESFANAQELDLAPRTIAAPLTKQIETFRDQAAIAQDRISRLHQIDAIQIGRALETGEALLVIGGPNQGVAAVDLEALLPSSIALERAGVSAAGVIGPRAQELIASALAQLVAPSQPILVYVHGGLPNELLGTSELFTKVTERLAERGIDTIEWAAVEEPTAPDLDDLDPFGIRPVVYAVISVDSAAMSGDSGFNGVKRAREMGKIVERLLQEGNSLAISLNPSIFPSFDSPDPISEAIADFGIVPDSGRPILHARIAPLGPIADPITRIVSENDNNNPISGAVEGLNTVLPWSVPMSLTPIEGIESSSILTLNSTENPEETWGEKDWLTLWRTEAQSRKLMRNQPVFNEDTDLRLDQYILAAAAQRDLAGTQQRLVVIGSNGWSTDSIIADTERLVDGRVLSRWPGNLTLLDSTISWLAGMDDLIGPGIHARPIATIKNLDHGQRSLIRWLLLAGLPGFILTMGMAYRLIFG
ncbi:MAG: hypothetical protein P1U42_00690 [Phycisphaerales bacterium]|nr:hypothetical protein [Phycisphaerales bacterium]